MTRRNQVAGWLVRFAGLFIIFVALEIYRWHTRGHTLPPDRLFDRFMEAGIFAWLIALHPKTLLIYFLSWFGAAILGLIGYGMLEHSTHLSAAADTIVMYTLSIVQQLIGVGAVVWWLRTKPLTPPPVSQRTL